jgi:hypothetical protein
VAWLVYFQLLPLKITHSMMTEVLTDSRVTSYCSVFLSLANQQSKMLLSVHTFDQYQTNWYLIANKNHYTMVSGDELHTVRGSRQS